MPNKKSSLLARKFCELFGHNYKVSKKITPHIAEYTCSVCKCETTTDIKGNIINLTPERREINETLAHFYQKRQHVVQTA